MEASSEGVGLVLYVLGGRRASRTPPSSSWPHQERVGESGHAALAWQRNPAQRFVEVLRCCFSALLKLSFQLAAAVCDFSSAKYVCVDALECSPRSPVGEGVSGARQARLCTNHASPPSSSLSLRAYSTSDNATHPSEGKELVYSCFWSSASSLL